MRNGKRNALILATATVAGLVQVSRGANATWNGQAGASFWNAPNWDNGGPYTVAPNDALFFAANGTPNNRNDFVGASFSALTFNTGAQAFTLDGSDLALTGPLTVNSANGNTQTINFGITGATALNLGSDQSGGNNLTLNGNVTAAALNVTSQSATTNTITMGAGKILTINGNVNVGSVAAAGTLRTNLVVSGNELDVNGTVSIGKASTSGSNRFVSNVNLSGLSTFKSVSPTVGTFGVGVESQAVGTMTLANTLNQITAGTLAVGWAANSNSGTSDLFLGAGSNVLNVGTVVLGRGKGVGTMSFGPASTGSVTISGITGGTSMANIIIGSADSATATTGVSGLTLAGHQATVQASTVVVGQQTNNSNSTTGALSVTGTGVLTFDTGNFTAGTLQLANNTGGTSQNGGTGTVTLGTNAASTGSFNVTSAFSMGNLTNSATNTRTNSAFIINGGTANINADITLTNTTSNVATATITLNGGTLNMMGHKIGAANSATSILNVVMPASGQSATIANLGGTGINGAGLTMNGSGTLFIDGTNTFTGAAVVSAGTLTPTATASIAAPIEVRNGGIYDASLQPTIAAGRIISGNGTVAGNVTIAGTIAPGNNSVAGATAGTLTFANNLSLTGGGTLAFELSGDNTTGNDAIAVNGNLDLAGTTKIKLSALGSSFASGPYTLLTYASKTGAGTIQAPGAGLITRQQFTLNVGATATALTISGSPAATLTWTGDGATNTWDHTSMVWNNAGSADKFFDLDTVRFDDNGSASPSVNLVGALVPAAITVDSGSNDYTFAGSGSLTTDSLTKNNGRTLTITNSGVNTFGSVSLNGGTIVVLQNSTTSGSTTIANGAALQIGNGTTSGGTGLFANLVNNGTLIVNRSDTVVVTDNITGTGATQNLVGTLQIGAGGSTGSLGSGTITNSGTLVFNRSGLVSNSIIEGTGFVRKQGTGNVTLVGSSTYTGNTVIEAGKVLVGTSGTFTAGSTINQQNAFGNVTLKGNSTVGGTGRLDIRGTANNGVNTATLDLAGNTLTKSGNGQFTLVGANVTPGNIVVNSGTFSAETTTTMQGAGSVNIAGDNVTVGFFNVTDPTLNVRPYYFNGNNGTITNLSGGTPSIVGMNMILNKSVNVGLNTGSATAQGGLTINGNISGPGALTKTGNTLNPLVLAGTNTYTGGTTLQAGPLITNTNFSNGTLTITGGAAKVIAKTASNDPSGLTVVPAISVSVGSLDLTNNALIVDYTPGNSPLANVRSAIISGYANGAWNGVGINSSSALAAFGSANKTALGYAEASAVGIGTFAGAAVDNTSVVVAYTLAGDANLDLKVNALDFNALANGYGTTTSALWRQGDFNYDGTVNTDDFTLLSQNFNAPLASPAQALSPALGSLVPEPGTVSVIALAAASLGARRRRK